MPPRAVRQLLRSPKVILGEIAAFALAGALGAVAGDRHVFRTIWFVGLTVVTALSLSVVVVEQFRRFRPAWKSRLRESHFKNAPFRAEFERAATGAQSKTRIWCEGRLGSAGSLVFHSGLLLIMLAGALRALFGTEAVVDLMEDETLAPTAQAWSAQWPSVLGRPFCLNEPVTLRAVNATRYAGGDLRSLSVALETRRGSNAVPASVAVNQDLRVAGRRLFLGSDFGTAALVEWQQAGTDPVREAFLLKDRGKGGFAGTASGPANLRAHLFAQVNAAGDHPGSVEVRVMRDNALLFAGELYMGEAQALPGGTTLTLQGTPFWARLRGSHDPALWLAYAGMALAMLGATLIFTVIRCDFCVVVTPLGERERVFVALKPQRFAPLFRQRFDQLVRELGGDGDPRSSCCPVSAGRKPAGSLSSSRQCELSGAAPRLAAVALLAALLVAGAGCGRLSSGDARKLVERYNQVVSEAYRRGDVRLIDPVVGPNEGKKLAGLIGVRFDMGITLDSKLLSLDVQRVEQGKEELRVQTREHWSYRDLKIGTGEQVGEASVDAYEMLYLFKKIETAWLMDEIRFTSTPQVGRKTTTWTADRRTLHGFSKPIPGSPEANTK